ncbi:MAG: D-inositol-3-phosphate glycosyltransferase [Candidatus Argoarchaeum ethanivorans]|uniref:D-inositol-3-phosphate glycosyltransferase n=1 Tax=Candidatus Argoarchaeum ethanivorans TaxID=2608793 RepID=A0A811TB39_9EURY|nr:MAG: D-inositol-3-phosphate glycosyltransferase [Candidatus Argoarchaeum ethanivorans]
MKILRVVSDLYPSVVGGIGIHTHEMSKQQAKLGNEVTVYTSNTDGRPTQEYKDDYKIQRFKPILTIGGNSFIPMLFFKLFRTKNDFDIIHAHSHLFFSTNLCALVRRLGSPPLVITNHGLISQTVPRWVHKIYIPTIAKWTFKSADKIICYTENEKLLLVKLGIDSDMIAVIHNGTDTDIFAPREKEKDKNQILWIGRFTPGKGVEYLIDAFEILVKEYPDFKLLMIGRGPLKGNIEQMIRDLNLSKNIIMKEFVPNSKLPEIYQNSDVFVLPSLNEGVPRTILEAMACGIPVVCTKLPQLVDVVDGCGLLVPVEDSQALAEGISKIVFDRELAQKFGKNGRAKVVENYSWKDTVKKTVQLYEELSQEVKL